MMERRSVPIELKGGIWHTYWTNAKKDPILSDLLHETQCYFKLYYPFLQPKQVTAKAYEELGIPHYFGVVDRAGLHKMYLALKNVSNKGTCKALYKPLSITLKRKNVPETLNNNYVKFSKYEKHPVSKPSFKSQALDFSEAKHKFKKSVKFFNDVTVWDISRNPSRDTSPQKNIPSTPHISAAEKNKKDSIIQKGKGRQLFHRSMDILELNTAAETSQQADSLQIQETQNNVSFVQNKIETNSPLPFPAENEGCSSLNNENSPLDKRLLGSNTSLLNEEKCNDKISVPRHFSPTKKSLNEFAALPVENVTGGEGGVSKLPKKKLRNPTERIKIPERSGIKRIKLNDKTKEKGTKSYQVNATDNWEGKKPNIEGKDLQSELKNDSNKKPDPSNEGAIKQVSPFEIRILQTDEMLQNNNSGSIKKKYVEDSLNLDVDQFESDLSSINGSDTDHTSSQTGQTKIIGFTSIFHSSSDEYRGNPNENLDSINDESYWSSLQFSDSTVSPEELETTTKIERVGQCVENLRESGIQPLTEEQAQVTENQLSDSPESSKPATEKFTEQDNDPISENESEEIQPSSKLLHSKNTPDHARGKSKLVFEHAPDLLEQEQSPASEGLIQEASKKEPDIQSPKEEKNKIITLYNDNQLRSSRIAQCRDSDESSFDMYQSPLISSAEENIDEPSNGDENLSSLIKVTNCLTINGKASMINKESQNLSEDIIIDNELVYTSKRNRENASTFQRNKSSTSFINIPQGESVSFNKNAKIISIEERYKLDQNTNLKVDKFSSPSQISQIKRKCRKVSLNESMQEVDKNSEMLEESYFSDDLFYHKQKKRLHSSANESPEEVNTSYENEKETGRIRTSPYIKESILQTDKDFKIMCEQSKESLNKNKNEEKIIISQKETIQDDKQYDTQESDCRDNELSDTKLLKSSTVNLEGRNFKNYEDKLPENLLWRLNCDHTEIRNSSNLDQEITFENDQNLTGSNELQMPADLPDENKMDLVELEDKEHNSLENSQEANFHKEEILTQKSEVNRHTEGEQVESNENFLIKNYLNSRKEMGVIKNVSLKLPEENNKENYPIQPNQNPLEVKKGILQQLIKEKFKEIGKNQVIKKKSLSNLSFPSSKGVANCRELECGSLNRTYPLSQTFSKIDDEIMLSENNFKIDPPEVPTKECNELKSSVSMIGESNSLINEGVDGLIELYKINLLTGHDKNKVEQDYNKIIKEESESMNNESSDENAYLKKNSERSSSIFSIGTILQRRRRDHRIRKKRAELRKNQPEILSSSEEERGSLSASNCRRRTNSRLKLGSECNNFLESKKAPKNQRMRKEAKKNNTMDNHEAQNILSSSKTSTASNLLPISGKQVITETTDKSQRQIDLLSMSEDSGIIQETQGSCVSGHLTHSKYLSDRFAKKSKEIKSIEAKSDHFTSPESKLISKKRSASENVIKLQEQNKKIIQPENDLAESSMNLSNQNFEGPKSISMREALEYAKWYRSLKRNGSNSTEIIPEKANQDAQDLQKDVPPLTNPGEKKTSQIYNDETLNHFQDANVTSISKKETQRKDALSKYSSHENLSPIKILPLREISNSNITIPNQAVNINEMSRNEINLISLTNNFSDLVYKKSHTIQKSILKNSQRPEAITCIENKKRYSHDTTTTKPQKLLTDLNEKENASITNYQSIKKCILLNNKRSKKESIDKPKGHPRTEKTSSEDSGLLGETSESEGQSRKPAYKIDTASSPKKKFVKSSIVRLKGISATTSGQSSPEVENLLRRTFYMGNR